MGYDVKWSNSCFNIMIKPLIGPKPERVVLLNQVVFSGGDDFLKDEEIAHCCLYFGVQSSLSDQCILSSATYLQIALLNYLV